MEKSLATPGKSAFGQPLEKILPTPMEGIIPFFWIERAWYPCTQQFPPKRVWDNRVEPGWTHGRTLHLPVLLEPNIGLPPGSNLPRNLWVTLNRPRSGVGGFRSNMCQWGLWETALCICGEENQTAHHIIYHCEALRPPSSFDGLVSPGPEGVCWLGRLVGIAWGSLLIRKKKQLSGGKAPNEKFLK